MTQAGKVGIVEDAFLEKPGKGGSGTSTPARSRYQSPAASAAATPAGSGEEDGGSRPLKKKKKLTRNQMKERDERRRLRHLAWLRDGGAKPENTDSD